MRKLCVSIVLLLSVGVVIAQAPATQIDRLVVQQLDDEINVYSVSDGGSLSFLTTLSDFTLFDPDARHTKTWEIVEATDLVVSPDGQHFAFTVFGRSTALFIYTVGETGLQQMDTQGLATVKWSPDSSAILLAPLEKYFDWRLESAYVYKLDSETLAQLPDTPEGSGKNFYWLPDGNRIVYWDVGRFCAEPCVHASDIHMIDVDGQNTVVLTDLTAQLTEDTDTSRYLGCYGGAMAWSEAQQRLYYAVRCLDHGEYGHNLLYSVSLSGGDNRLEVDLSLLFPNHHATAVGGVFAGNIGGLFDGGDGDVFAVVESVMPERWRILRMNQSGALSVMVDEQLFAQEDPQLFSTQISSNKQIIVMNGWGRRNGYLAVADLSTGDVTVHATENPVCLVEMLNRMEILYTEFSESCYDGSRVPVGTWRLRIDPDSRRIPFLTTPLEGTVWVLPLPETLFEVERIEYLG